MNILSDVVELEVVRLQHLHSNIYVAQIVAKISLVR